MNKQTNTSKNKYFQKFLNSELIGVFFGVPVAGIYGIALVNLPENVMKNFVMAILAATIIVVGFIALPLNIYIGKRRKESINKFYSNQMTSLETKKIFLQLSRLPFMQGLLIFIRILFGAFLVVAYFYFVLNLNLMQSFIVFALGSYGGFLAGILSYLYISHINKNILIDIYFSNKLDNEFIKKKKIFGLTNFKKSILFIFIPLIFSNLVLFFSFTSLYISIKQGEASIVGLNDFYIKFITAIGLNIIVSSFLFLIYYRFVSKKINVLQDSMKLFAENSGDLTGKIGTDLSDEYEYISFLINLSFENFRKLLNKISKMIDTVTESSQSITTSSKEISATSTEQSEALNKMLTNMNTANNNSKQITIKISEVTKISNENKEMVQKGYSLLQRNLSQINEIKNTNDDTIQGIKILGNKINNIWDIVKIINNIASQTKIIAFNAELESAAAGEMGKNFQIVAGEIRRLADSTVDSINKIKKKISEIQNSSDNLVIASEDSTEKIKKGLDISTELKNIFDKILNSSEISSRSSNQISNSMLNESELFENILKSLKQISEGIKNFAISTNDTVKSVTNLESMIMELQELIGNYKF